MRRVVVQFVLPLVFCALPPAAAYAVWSALPKPATTFYIDHISSMDILIIALGFVLFVLQLMLSFRALRWRGNTFDERFDGPLSRLGQAAEWFPLLGLLGTVAAILQTFGSINGPTAPERIIQMYAPAITATGSGLFAALFNILPLWIVMFGRDLIRSTGGEAPTRQEVAS